MKNKEKFPLRPAQSQPSQPGEERPMDPKPVAKRLDHQGTGKLMGKVALITGGDSGIGKAVGIAFAREGADVAISYLSEESDAREAKRCIEEEGRRCMLLAGDVGEESHCQQMINTVLEEWGRLDVLVNNAAEQHPQSNLLEISTAQWENTFRTNVFSYFFLTKAALPHLSEGSCVINTTSVTAYRGSAKLVDYSATKGAIVAFTRSLALQLAPLGIRVNAVAPGPIWTPLIPSTFEPEEVATFGSDVPMKRAGEPAEVAPCYVFLATSDSAYMSGQVLHPNGGEIVNA